MVNDLRNLVYRHLGIDLAVDRNSRCDTAGADTAQGIDGEQAVSCGLTGLDAENFGELVNDLLRAFDIPAEKICVLNLPDPYGRGQDAYYAAAARIVEAVEELLEEM